MAKAVAPDLAAPDLVAPATAAGTSTALDPAPLGPDTVRARLVQLKPAAARSLLAIGRSASTSAPAILRVAFFDDFKPALALEKAVSYGRDQLSYLGRVEGHPGATATMSVVESALVLDVRLADGRTFTLRPAPGAKSGSYLSAEIAESAQGGCGVDASFRDRAARISKSLAAKQGRIPRQTRPNPVAPAADTADEVDVLVAYTPAARAAAGGTPAITAEINNAITNANATYANSLVPFIIVPVWVGEVEHVESNVEMLDDLFALTNLNDGVLDSLHALRDAHRADMVALITSQVVAGICGYGWQMNAPFAGFESLAFSVTARPCLTNQTLTHELGHNMGCAHARGDGGNGSYSYSFGHRFTGANSLAYRTIMAYAPGQRILHFSNPDVQFLSTPTGVAIGQPTEAHNAQTLVLNAPTIANWRQRKTGSDPATLLATSAINLGVVDSGDNAPDRNIVVGNGGDGPMDYTLASNSPWITAGPGGSVNGSTQKAVLEPVSFQLSSLPPGAYTGTITVSAPAAAGSPRTVSITVVVADPAGPANNDLFANAYTIDNDSITTTINTTGYGVETGEPNAVLGYTSGASAWWNWTNSAATTRSVTIQISSATFDTQLSVYTGAAVNALTVVTEADEFSPTLETINFNAAPGQTYRIRLAGYNAEFGTATFNGTLPVTLRMMVVE